MVDDYEGGRRQRLFREWWAKTFGDEPSLSEYLEEQIEQWDYECENIPITNG